MAGHRHLGPKPEKERKLFYKLSLLFNYYNMENFILYGPSVPLSFLFIKFWICNINNFSINIATHNWFKALATIDADPITNQRVHLQGSLDKTAGSSLPNRWTWKLDAELWTQFIIPTANLVGDDILIQVEKNHQLQCGGNTLLISLGTF